MQLLVAETRSSSLGVLLNKSPYRALVSSEEVETLRARSDRVTVVVCRLDCAVG